ncbi:MAG TPA: hypothetical protein VFL93_06625, partial [Longimicrobiaceae bacterium]|nr:hypothetical protein [Longimicrobiaceae bacterium]
MHALGPSNRRQGAALRALLSETLGWEPMRGTARLAVDGVAYRVRLLARRRAMVALLCEAPLGTDLPDYAARRRLRRALVRRYPGLLALFTDAAHSEQVWSWTEPVAGVPVYCEASRRPDRLNPRLHWRLAALATRLEEAEGAQQGGTAPAGAVSAALLRLIRLRAPGLRAVVGDATVAAHVRVRRLIEESGDGAQLRAVWWALRTLRVLDPACGTGEWLLAARAALEPLYVACLERMQSAIDDLRRARTP